LPDWAGRPPGISGHLPEKRGRPVLGYPVI
jgi:hypothetical protein